MINPLHNPGTIFDMPLMNPNPTSSKTQAGPVYRVTFEVDREVWDLFMEAETKGMLLAAKACAVADGQMPVESPAAGAHEFGAEAKTLRLHTVFMRNPRVWRAIGTDAEFQAWARSRPCIICGGMDYPNDYPDGINEYAHVRRAGEAGTGYKPAYSGVPMCHEHHSMQHQHGELRTYAEHCRIKQKLLPSSQRDASLAADWFNRKRMQAVADWVWERLPHILERNSNGERISMGDIAPEVVEAWAEKNGLFQYLPDEYK